MKVVGASHRQCRNEGVVVMVVRVVMVVVVMVVVRIVMVVIVTVMTSVVMMVVMVSVVIAELLLFFLVMTATVLVVRRPSVFIPRVYETLCGVVPGTDVHCSISDLKKVVVRMTILVTVSRAVR